MTDSASGEGNSLTVYFDGHCNLCNFWVDFLLRADKHGRLSFVALPTGIADSRDNLHPERAISADSIRLDDNGRSYDRSTAVLRILKHLGGLWAVLFVLMAIPRPLRDSCYDFVARNRYRWFGRRIECRIPQPHERGRFRD